MAFSPGVASAMSLLCDAATCPSSREELEATLPCEPTDGALAALVQLRFDGKPIGSGVALSSHLVMTAGHHFRLTSDDVGDLTVAVWLPDDARNDLPVGPVRAPTATRRAASSRHGSSTDANKTDGWQECNGEVAVFPVWYVQKATAADVMLLWIQMKGRVGDKISRKTAAARVVPLRAMPLRGWMPPVDTLVLTVFCDPHHLGVPVDGPLGRRVVSRTSALSDRKRGRGQPPASGSDVTTTVHRNFGVISSPGRVVEVVLQTSDAAAGRELPEDEAIPAGNGQRPATLCRVKGTATTFGASGGLVLDAYGDRLVGIHVSASDKSPTGRRVSEFVPAATLVRLLADVFQVDPFAPVS